MHCASYIMNCFKCKMCGGTIEFEPGATVGVCDSCGTKQTLPKTTDDTVANLFNRANNLRLKCEFDKAAAIYEKIVEQDDTEAEAHWGIVLCKYGIEYVDDPATGNKIPTCHRTLFEAVTTDADYQAAIDYSDAMQQAIYETEARTIDRIQKDILNIVKNEKPFDVFICYKETDENGKRTQDSAIANDIYYQLTQEGFKVFYAAITLEDKLGQEYEPYIFAALNSAKVMLVVGTNPMYFNAVWVRNEWSRYLKLMKTDRKKLLIPCYRDMDAYELPEEFAHLQAQDMSKIGFINDVVRGIKKVITADTPKVVEKETVVVSTNNASTAPLLKRAFMFLEDGNWEKADDFCEQVLNLDPECAEAYLGKLMAELHVRNRKQLADCGNPFDDRDNYSKVLRFGDEKLEAELRGYIAHINERNENARLTGIYNSAKSAMKASNTETSYKAAALQFQTIQGFQDSDALAKHCLEQAEICRKDAIYFSARSKMTGEKVTSYEEAIKIFQSVSGWKDVGEQILACQKKIEEIKAKEAAERQEAERKAEERRIAAEKAAKKRKKIIAIATPVVCACVALLILLNSVIIPQLKYNRAVSMYDSDNYESAIEAFEALDGYKDSNEQIKACRTAIDYVSAVALMEAGDYKEAISAFGALDGYKDSDAQIEACRTTIMDNEYISAVALMDNREYEEAITAFEALDGYKDSGTKIETCQTAIKDNDYEAAVTLMDNCEYEEAISAFEALDGYKDSDAQIEACQTAITAIKDQDYASAVALMESGDYEAAIAAFEALDGYQDSEEKLQSAKQEYQQSKLSKATVGDTVIFGSYEQDNNTSNGKEDIKWQVLAKQGNKILVISEKALDCRQYNTSYTAVTWETCSLRKWMNSTFLNNAFSAEEQALILSTTVSADKNPEYSTNPGSATTDKVFLLSITEAEKYFSSDEDRKCVPTAYAIAQGAYTSDSYKKGGAATCWWWLRSPGFNQLHAARVDNVGSVGCGGSYVNGDDDCVRPALWITLDS